MNQPYNIPHIPRDPKPTVPVAGFPLAWQHAAPGNVVCFTLDGQRLTGIVSGRSPLSVFLRADGHNIAADADEWDDLDVCHA